ncbi:hypothetical protein M427DRAFT_51540 [Gonapodya prolifera JEL478]|uniref:Uncharacterized protein n=1 Tax=Gonapodya prolifera (strain JEL478) TaxID=1344416 RepID=A0A139AXK3_GONPJ|nr:hypothetical protein M427DRAFT_51540 [Gonapodya prolifera JEL478]|eukprot:KXS21303.1 hypothetical protein M427DRAFT_51540 [Gonapodya prolifera JEL478]
MYNAGPEPVTVWRLPNTLVGDTAVTTIVTCIITWLVGGQLTTLNVRRGVVKVAARPRALQQRWLDETVAWMVGPGWDFVAAWSARKGAVRLSDGKELEPGVARVEVSRSGATSDAQTLQVAGASSSSADSSSSTTAFSPPDSPLQPNNRFLTASLSRWPVYLLLVFLPTFPILTLILAFGLEPRYATWTARGGGVMAFGNWPLPAVYKGVAGGAIASFAGVVLDALVIERGRRVAGDYSKGQYTTDVPT